MRGTSQLARAVAGIGGGTLARAWRRARRAPGRALVLMYHRVSDEPDYLGMAVSPEVFVRQLRVLRRRARVLPLVEVATRLRDASPLAEDVAAVTFDDGYRDNLEVALPLLRAEGVPATVFVATEFIDGTRRPAGERLRVACEALWQRRVSPAAWRGEAPVDVRVRDVLAARGSLEAVGRLRQALKALPHDGEQVMRGLEDAAGTGAVRSPSMLDWDGVRTLAQGGIEIGSHAMSHAILSRLPPAEAEHEIRASRARLEAEIGGRVVGFAFPNGRQGDFLPEHLVALRGAGYAYACTAETGVNVPGCDAFQLRRIGVGNDSEGLLDLKLALGRAA